MLPTESLDESADARIVRVAEIGEQVVFDLEISARAQKATDAASPEIDGRCRLTQDVIDMPLVLPRAYRLRWKMRWRGTQE